MAYTSIGGGVPIGERQAQGMYGGLWDRYKKKTDTGDLTNVGAGGLSATATTPGAIAGLPGRAYEPAYGGIPQVPLPASTQSEAISANLKNLPELLDLSSQLNAYNLAQQRKQYEASFPNYAGTEAQIAQNIGAGARGELSPGVMRNLANAAAERAVSRGMPINQGGPTVGNMNYLNLLGTTTEQLQQNALNQLGAYNATSPRTALFNPAAFAISPDAQYNAALQASIFNAAPVPSAATQAAIKAAKSGANFGFGGARAPAFAGGYQAPSTGANLTSIFQRYAPTAGLNANQYMPSANASQSQGSALAYGSIRPFDYSTIPQMSYGGAGPTQSSQFQGVYQTPSYTPSFDYSFMNQPPSTISAFDYSTIPTELYPSANM